MTDNPYEYKSTKTEEKTSDENAVAVPPPVCPLQIHITKSVDQHDAIQRIRECRPIVVPNPVTGKTPKQLSPTVLFVAVLTILALAIAREIFLDIRSGNVTFENQLFWITTVTIPLVSLLALIVILYRYRTKLENADPPIWTTVGVKLDSEWYEMAKKLQCGHESMAIFCWSKTDISLSSNAWILHRMQQSPVLILREWLTREQQAQFDQFLCELTQWRGSPGAQLYVASDTEILPARPMEGIPFRVTQHQVDEYLRLQPQINRTFPQASMAALMAKLWIWKTLALCVLISALVRPVYLLLFGGGRLGISWSFGCVLAWAINAIFKKPVAPDSLLYAGQVTKSMIYFDDRTMQSSLPLARFDRRILLDDTILLAAKEQKLPTILFRSGFQSKADWAAVCQQLAPTPAELS